MARPIVIVDYHKGNLRSVERGLAEAGGTALVTDDPAAIAAADALVLPGVGSFGDAMAYLRESGQAEAILAALGRGGAVPRHLPRPPAALRAGQRDGRTARGRRVWA